MNLWNIKNLEPPATSSCKLENQEINLHELNGLMTDALNLFSSQIFLDAEYKLLHTFISVRKHSLRTMIGFKILQKLNRCARNYQEADYRSLIEWFRKSIPFKYEKDTYFPSRNLLDYFLVRSKGIGKLIVRLLEMCKEAHRHWMDKLLLGHIMGMGIIVIGIISRMFIIFRYLLQCICHLYDSLVAMRDKVPNVKTAWLSSNYKLPKVLLPWLDVDWAYREDVYDLQGKNRDLFSINIFDDDAGDVEFCKEYKIVDGDNTDLQIVNEYMNILDSDDERPIKIEEIDEDLQVIHSGLQSMICRIKKAQVINLDDEIGEPASLDGKVEEVSKKLEGIRSLDGVVKFMKDGSHEYFRSNNKSFNERIAHLLNMIDVYKNKETKTKQERKQLLQEVKEKIINVVKSES